MGWQLENTPEGSRHAGYLAGYLANGTTPTYRAGAALYEREFTDSPTGPGGTWSGPDADGVDQPVRVAPACRCGWFGNERPYDPHGGQWSDGRQHNGQSLDVYGEWKAHATAVLVPEVPDTPGTQLAELARHLGELADERPRSALTLARQLREIAEHLEPLAVAQALAHGVSWETIGTDLDQTRQSVHRRYSQPSANLEQRVSDLTGGTVAQLLTAARDRKRGTPPPAPSARWTQAVTRALRTPATES